METIQEECSILPIVDRNTHTGSFFSQTGTHRSDLFVDFWPIWVDRLDDTVGINSVLTAVSFVGHFSVCSSATVDLGTASVDEGSKAPGR